jgi:hypothetical protein
MFLGFFQVSLVLEQLLNLKRGTFLERDFRQSAFGLKFHQRSLLFHLLLNTLGLWGLFIEQAEAINNLTSI